jgi:hypothetical protein
VRGFAWIVFTIAALAARSSAEPTPDNPGPEPGATPKLITPVTAVEGGFSHEGKIGFSARLGLGLRAIATYDEKVYCGSTDSTVTTGNAPVCLGRSPLALGFEVSYGVTRRVDILAELQLGLEQDFASSPSTNDGPHPVWLSPGARFWFSEAAKSSLFVTAQAVLDVSGYKGVSGTDVGVRSLQGYWYDISRSFGLYLYASETATVARWIDLGLDIGIGFQGRYP